MMQRPTYDHRSSQKSALPRTSLATSLGDLYWLALVVDAGSFSAAAQRTGIAKSNLSRRIIQLEKRLDVQLLIRQPRALHLTPTGTRIYRHALDMLHAAQAVEDIARHANGLPRGPLHVCAPGVLSPWLYENLRSFSEQFPEVELCLSESDDVTDLASNQLDISLNLHEVPGDATDIVSRALARLEMVIVGTPHLVEKLGHPRHLAEVDDRHLVMTRSARHSRPWILASGKRTANRAALYARDYLGVLSAARAGLGLACVPLSSCLPDLHAGHLQRTCLAEHPVPATLHGLTNPHRSITPAARALVEHLRDGLAASPTVGMAPLEG